METVTDFMFLGSNITADGDCSHEIKRHLLLGRKTMTNLVSQSVQLLSHVQLFATPWTAACQASLSILDSFMKEQRHYFASKGLSSQSYGFPSSYVWIWELGHKEGWMLKNWCFWTVVLEKTLEKSQSILKEISPEYSLEGVVLKLELQYFGHLMWRTDSLE